jgi:hypothetical protein
MQQNICEKNKSVVYSRTNLGIPTFWLQITVNKSHQMEILKGGGDLGCIESSSIFRNAFPRPSLESYKHEVTSAST